MALDTDLGPLTELAESLGILVDGDFNPSWFENPLGETGPVGGGGGATKPGLTTTLYDDRQREALIAFADEALGSPDRRELGDAVWLPLVSHTGLTLYVVVEEPPDRPLQVGIGAEYSTAAGDVELSITAHVRAFQIDRQGHAVTSTGGAAPWLLLGQPAGTIDLRIELTNTAAPTPNEFHLGGASIGGTIPTSSDGELSVDVRLDQLQLPGADVPRDHHLDLDSLDTAAADVLGFVIGLIKAQADAIDDTDPATRPFAALASLLGLRTTDDVPDLPLAELLDRGVDPLVEWIESTLLSTTSRNAWLGELAELLGGTAEPDRGSVVFTAGPVSVRVGVRTTTGANGSAVVTPWTELSLSARDGGDVRIRADLFSIDTTTGSTSAFPVIDGAAVFGARATNGATLLDDGVEIGTVEIGLRVADGRPAFALVARDVELPSGVRHEVVDLSSPEAVRDVAGSVVGSELTSLIATLGDAGTAINRVLGLDPPAGVTGVDAVALLTQPLPAVAGYWSRLVAAPTALASVIEELARLVIAPTISIAGAGTATDPWTMPLGEPSAGAGTSATLVVWVDGSSLALDLVVDRTTTVLDTNRVRLSGRLALARVDVATPTVDLVTGVTARLELTTADGSPLTIDLDPASVTVDGLAVNVGWRSRADRSGGGRTPSGLAVTFDAPGLAVDLRPLGGGRHDIRLPRFQPDGSLTWAPEWADVEDLLVSLLGQVNDPTLTLVLEIIGWLGDGAYLPLVDLVADPAAALKRWLADLVLDCENTVAALTPLTELLSGFTVHRPFGFGSARRPYRAPIAGEPGAPGISAWLDPACPLPETEPESGGRPGVLDPSAVNRGPEIVAALDGAATALPDLGDLLVGRLGLADGLTQLVDRLAGTDGVIGRPSTLPAGVTGHDADGYGYRSLIALGIVDRLGPLVVGEQPDNRLYLGIEAEWADAFTASVDRSTVEAIEAAAGFSPPAGSEPWSARLPSLAAARTQRPERNPLEEQARRIVDVVAGRTTPVTVIAYGQAGAAAVVAAGLTDTIARIITVGSPWSEPATNAFSLGLGGDALRFVTRLTAPPSDLPELAMALEASPATTLEHAIARLATAGTPPVSVDVTDLLDASEFTAPSGLPIDAVFGRLQSEDLWQAVAMLVEFGIDDRYEHEDDAGGTGTETGTDSDDEADDDPAPEELRLGLDLPTLDIDLGGLLVGTGARLEAYRFDRDETTGELRVHDEQDLILTFHLGLTDGWLVGGPTAASTDIEVRWVELRVTLPLDDRPSHTTVVLHEARCFDVFRERWEVDAEQLRATPDTTTSLPEVHLILGEVARRLRVAVPEVADGGEEPTNAVIELLDALGITRNRGYDPAGFERFLFSPSQSVESLLTDPVAAASLIRELAAYAPAGSGPTGTG
ncbi:MAG: hypothetical protein OEW83_08820, partial [Acidimicrobiia bacterium]|nr:hypothetical protein [Acidimicrobiia bacterium]